MKKLTLEEVKEFAEGAFEKFWEQNLVKMPEELKKYKIIFQVYYNQGGIDASHRILAMIKDMENNN